MASSSAFPPPPPPPPTPPEQHGNESRIPTEQLPMFLSPHVQQRPPLRDRRRKQHDQAKLQKQRQLQSEIIFPPTIPHKCHARVPSMVKLLQALNDSGTQEGGAGIPDPVMLLANNGTSSGNNNETPEPENEEFFSKEEQDRVMHGDTISLLKKMQAINKKCDPYRRKAKASRSLIVSPVQEQVENMNQQPMTTDSLDGVKMNEMTSSNDKSRMENNGEHVARTTINEFNYRFCIAANTCPERMTRLVSCWKSMDPKIMQQLAEHDVAEIICQEERESVERCTGRTVQQFMRLALG
mmetsp:Transcript_20705/g.37435  ORF Transcript_20705/g.37435 Transcript_20705/m.37435 type:complete len:296 (-) Transcript_20705:1497-2384(-)